MTQVSITRGRLITVTWCLACDPGASPDHVGRDTDGSGGAIEPRASMTEFNIDCTRMTRAKQEFNDFIWSFNTGLWVESNNAGTLMSPRCWFHLSPTMTGSDTLTVTDDYRDPQGDVLGLQFNLDSGEWYAADGDVNVTKFEFNGKWVEGTYDVRAQRWDGPTRTGEFVRVHGEFSWCDYLRYPECPGAPVDRLEQRFSASTPEADTTFDTDGGVSECRAILDTSTGGLIVDMEFATWRGYNVGRILVPECTTSMYNHDLGGNRLHFEAGGTSGPGAYGPHRVHRYPGNHELPNLSWTRPSALYSGQCYEFFTRSQHVLTTTAASTCSWAVEPDGHVTIDCTDVQDDPTSGGILLGDTHIETDCTLIER